MDASSPPTTAKAAGKKAPKSKPKKNKPVTSTDVVSRQEDIDDDDDSKDEAPPALAMNGANGQTRSSDTDALRRDLDAEKEKSKELQRQMAGLSATASTAGKTAKKLIAEETARAKRLTAEVQSLREELAAAARAAKGGDTAQEEELQDLRGRVEEERKARQNAEKQAAHVQEQKDNVDAQYRNLLGRVSTIRTTLGERMKADAEELAQTKQIVFELEEQNRTLNDAVFEQRDEVDRLQQEKDATSKELSSVRNRLNLAQQNWNKERDDLIQDKIFIKEEYEEARQAVNDWEVIATEERAVRESLSERVIELEESLAVQKDIYARIATEYEKQGSSMNGLQRALQEIQEARKKELREIVENTQSQITTLTTKCETLDKISKEAESSLNATKKDLERVLPFEKDVKEKNLLIGKLRHEAVTLNDHLRNALRILKRNNADDKIDKQLVTNVFLQFVSIQRGDARKYEVLQLIASVLDWTEEQREKAGLLRPGTAANTGGLFGMRSPPLSPFHRSPSTPALSESFGDEREIWSRILDTER